MRVLPCLKQKLQRVWCSWIHGYSLNRWGGVNLCFAPHTSAKGQPAFLPSWAYLFLTTGHQFFRKPYAARRGKKVNCLPCSLTNETTKWPGIVKPQCFMSMRFLLTSWETLISPVPCIWDMLLPLWLAESGHSWVWDCSMCIFASQGKRSWERVQEGWEVTTHTQLASLPRGSPQLRMILQSGVWTTDSEHSSG